LTNPLHNPVPLPPEVAADGEKDEDARGDLGGVDAVVQLSLTRPASCPRLS